MAYRVSRMVIAFLVGIVVARYLGPEQYGQLSYALAFITIFMGVAGPGMKDVVTRRFDLGQNSDSAIIRSSFRLMLISNLLMLGAALLVMMILRPGEELILMMAVVIGLGNLFRAFEIYELWFHFKLEMGKTVAVQAVSFLLVSMMKIGFVLGGISVFWFAVVMGAELLLSAIGFRFIFGRDRNKPVTGKTDDATLLQTSLSILKESVPSIAGLAFILLLFKADQVMLGWLHSDAEVGYYSVVIPFSESWLYIAIAVMTSVYPALLEKHRESAAAFNAFFRKTTGSLLWIAILIIIPVWFLGEFIILLFLGEPFAPSADILTIHVWSLLFIFLIEIMKKWYVIRQKLNLFLMIAGFAALFNILVNYWLIPLYGGIGAAWASVASYSIAGFFGLLIFSDTRSVAVLIIKSIPAPAGIIKSKLK